MKWLCIALALALVLAFGLPFREYDTAKLLPIQTLQGDIIEGQVCLVSEAGEGTGPDFLSAVENLRENAAGDVFFETTEHLILCSEALLPQIIDSRLLRPSAQLYTAPELQAPEGLWEYLAAHPSAVTLGEVAVSQQ